MIQYAFEFLILHTFFYLIFKVLLVKETQLRFLRFYLVATTALSLILPLIEIPVATSFSTINTQTILLPAIVLSEKASTISWPLLIAILVCTAFAVRFALNLISIYKCYKKSEQELFDDTIIRRVNGLKNSFTFFRLIFIDPENFENPEDIVRHEKGHAEELHSLDILFCHLLTICFWWAPSIWLMIRELRTVHEFQADDYAIKINNSTYVKTLVHCTLKAHGMDLASSFDDAPIFNRLNFMKKMKKKVSTWKMASIAVLVAASAIILACEEKREAGNIGNDQDHAISTEASALENSSATPESEVFAQVDESAEFPGGIEGWGKFLSTNLKYPNQASKLGVEGRVFIQFIVEKDGSLSNIEVLKGIGAGCDKEAKRVVTDSPKWIPGKIAGESVRQKYIQNIYFKLPS